MTTPTREPISAARNGASAASVALQTALIVWVLKHSGLDLTDDAVERLAAGAAALWAFVAGAVARVCRDRLHQHESGERRVGVLAQIGLTLGSALG